MAVHYSTESMTPEALFAGANDNYTADEVVVLAGQGKLTRGTVLGKILYAIGAPAAAEGNTGTGTITGHALLDGAKIGTYTLKCITTAANGGTFSVVDPDGVRLDDAVVGTAYSGGGITFKINDGTGDGSADFAAGDTFTIEVSAGSGSYKKVLSTAVDGSQHADCILGEDVDATLAAATAGAYFQGEFCEDYLTFGGTDTADTHRATLQAKGIILRSSVPA